MKSERPPRSLGKTGRFRSVPSQVSAAALCFWLGALSLVPACDAPSAEGPVGSNTNWLVACDETAECGGQAACVCGACSLECASDGDCGQVGGARCVTLAEPAVRSQCRSDAPALALGMCLEGCEPGGCPFEQACVEGACVVREPVDAELCSALPASEAASRARQDALLGLVEGLRTAGGVACGGAEPSGAVPALRWDARLTCAARALAGDMATTRRRSLLDSAGRDTVARLALVGYSPRAWSESYALVAGDESAALAAILGDQDSCTRLVSPALTEVGVGNVGDAYVVTIASE